MNIGDSVVFIRNIDTMQKRGYLMYNEAFKQGGTIKGFITILGVFRTQEAISKDQEQEAIKEKAREIVAMEQFLKDKNITGYVKTTGGVFIKLHQQGNGPKVDSGMVVSVNYTGALKNGNKFDSNVDSAFGHPGPFEFVAKGNGVIPGWDEAIVYLNKGAKATLYIPAMLAYGPNAQGDKLPAFSDLIFDIDVKDVRPNTATSAPTVQLNGQ
jgi:FKBP-type peptidyl-prolyl cis-trans isomerase FkpA